MQTGPAKVLIVDDEPEVCALVRAQLSECGCNCEIATEPQHAKELLAGRPIDLVIFDITMPEISGLDLLAHIRQHACPCTAILATGASKREYVAQALMLGAFDYVEQGMWRPARALKGSAGLFRAQGVVEAATRLENAGRDPDFASARTAFGVLAAERTALAGTLKYRSKEKCSCTF